MTQEFAKEPELSAEAQLRYDLLTTALDYAVPFADAVDFANRAAKFVLFGDPDAGWVDPRLAMGGGVVPAPFDAGAARGDGGESVVDLKAWHGLGSEPVDGRIVEEKEETAWKPEPGELAAIARGVDLSGAREQLLDAEFPALKTTLSPYHHPNGTLNWCDAFVAELKTLLPSKTIAECAAHFNTTAKALSVGMCARGIRKSDLMPKMAKAPEPSAPVKAEAPKAVAPVKTAGPMQQPVQLVKPAAAIAPPPDPVPIDRHYQPKDEVAPMTAAPPRPSTQRERDLRPADPAERAAIDEAVAAKRVTKLPSMMELHPYLKGQPALLTASDAVNYLKAHGLNVTGGLRVGKVDGKRFTNSAQLIQVAADLQRAQAMAAWKKDHAA